MRACSTLALSAAALAAPQARVAARGFSVPPTRRLALASLLGLSALTRSPLLAFASAEAGSCPSMVGLEESRIIPDLIDRVAAASQAELVVEFPGGKAVQNGMLLAPKAAASTPKASIKGGSEGVLFTLVCTDPDPPDPANPVKKEWLHWIVANIPAGADASKGHEVTSYRGPSPPIGTHRYVFMLFQQPNQEPLQVEDPSGGDAAHRAHFSTRKFAAQHNLGDPVAVTWFNSHK